MLFCVRCVKKDPRTMKLSTSAKRIAAALCFTIPTLANAIDEIDREIAEIALISGTLTNTTRMSEGQDVPTCTDCTDLQVFYKDKESWAVVTRLMNRDKCLIVFSDSAIVARDWIQNLAPTTSLVCDKEENECCKVRQGFKLAFQSNLVAGGKDGEVEQALRNCAAGCSDSNNCVVVGGYSQGAASTRSLQFTFAISTP